MPEIPRSERKTQKAMELLLTKYLKAGISYRGIHRVESLPVPEDALREALLNAIIHRDYSVGSPIQIRVYADRLKIWNPGELPERWTVGKLVGPHSSRPYNPNVANAFFRAGEIEAWGRGIQRIYDACREAGTPPPKIQYEPGDLWIEFPFSPAYLAVVTSPVPRGDGLGDGLGDDAQSRLLRIIRARPASSITELARQLKISTTAVEKTIKRLKAKGVGNALVQPSAGIGKFSSEQKGRPCLNNPAPNAKRRTGSPPCSRTRPGPIASATATSASGTSRRTTAPSSRP